MASQHNTTWLQCSLPPSAASKPLDTAVHVARSQEEGATATLAMGTLWIRKLAGGRQFRRYTSFSCLDYNTQRYESNEPWESCMFVHDVHYICLCNLFVARFWSWKYSPKLHQNPANINNTFMAVIECFTREAIVSFKCIYPSYHLPEFETN